MPIQMFSCSLIINLHITMFCVPLVRLSQFCPKGLNLVHCSFTFHKILQEHNPNKYWGLLSYRTQCFKVSVNSDEHIFLIHQAVGIRYFFLIQLGILEKHTIRMTQQLKTKSSSDTSIKLLNGTSKSIRPLIQWMIRSSLVCIPLHNILNSDNI